MKKLLFVIFAFLLFFSAKHQLAQWKYDDRIEIMLYPINEECDTYNVIWEVKNVYCENEIDFEFLIGEGVYLTNSKKSYKTNLRSITVSGYLYKIRKEKDFIGCNDIWFFDDSKLK